MVVQSKKVKAIKVGVYKWKERMINEELSNCGLLQCTIINEIMHVKRQNNDFLEASRKCSIVPLEPLMVDLSCSYKCSYPAWHYLCFRLLTKKEGGLITLKTAWWLSETIAGYLTSNYHVTRVISPVGERDFKIVVSINVYMKSIIDESLEIDLEFSLNREALMYEELMHSDVYGLEQREIIGPIHDFLLEVEEKNKILEDFLESDRNSLLNLYASSRDGNMILCSIIEWLKTKEPHRICLNPKQESWFLEVRPALKMKKFDPSCDSYSQENCAICLEGLCEGDKVVVTPCCHIFHCHSIVGWLAKGKMTCPMCRTVCPVMI
ncbi:hypothetical protein LIER_43057 [Lithospermum erythrorhizon]|uniref:RING-type domain-containing protein n=1 Tax=Lithospermum erythrorhizon TaxID=34254 RepID=A0AAV3PCT7_LITER